MQHCVRGPVNAPLAARSRGCCVDDLSLRDIVNVPDAPLTPITACTGLSDITVTELGSPTGRFNPRASPELVCRVPVVRQTPAVDLN